MDHPIDRAARLLGSQVALASALGVTKAAVGQWKDTGRRVPAEHCPVIERLTRVAAAARGKNEQPVFCEDLRPDVDWQYLREQEGPDPA